jgi:cystathionine beta-lyase/cystathionine gamma-synthase
MKEFTSIIDSIPVDPLTGAIRVPIYQTSTYVQDAPGVNKGFDYTRTNNPTRKICEEVIAKLEGGSTACAFASGLSAIDSVIKLLNAGDEIVAVDDIYGGAYRLLTTVYNRFGISVKFVDTTDTVKVAAALTKKTKLIWLESPTNPLLKISNISAISNIARNNNILLCVDNTFASPILQQPISLGADIVIHSATKYLGGHFDVLAGFVITKTPELGEQIKYIQNAAGAVLSPFDSWLILRSIDTLKLRVERHSENALAVAEYLSTREEIKNLYYPGLKSHRNHELASKQQKAFGAIISFSLKDDTGEAALRFVTSTNLFKLAESLGGPRSLCCHPATMTHKSIPREVRLKSGITDSLIRLSIGLEDSSDLIDELDRIFNGLSCIETVSEAKYDRE